MSVDIIDARDYDISTDHDCLAAWSKSMAQAVGGACIYWPAGIYHIDGKPDPIQPGISINGAPGGRYMTTFVRVHQPHDPAEFFFELMAGNVEIKRLAICAGKGTTSGIAIGGVAAHGCLQAPGSLSLIEDVLISGDGTWLRDVYFNGSPKTNGAIGVRSLTLNRLEVFQATETNIYLAGIKGLRAYGLNIVGTPAYPSYGGLFMADLGMSNDDLDISGCQFGDVLLDNVVSCTLAAGSVRKFSTYDKCVGVTAMLGGDPVELPYLHGTNIVVHANGRTYTA